MRISIVLPIVFGAPIGGYLVQYQLADHLVGKGHRVTIAHCWALEPLRGRSVLRGFAAATKARLMGRRRLIRWYTFDPRVKVRVIPWPSLSFLPRADVTVLTAWQTSEGIRKPSPRSGPLAQIVYDYEYWRGAEESTRARIENALSLTAVSHIATSTVVRLMLDEFGTTVVATVPPGIDTTRYRVITPPEDRRLVIGFANRGEDFKGINDVLPVLGQLKEAYPAIRVSCFGDNGVHSLPAWVDDRHHLSDAELVDFYNRCAIFVLPSHYEGFGLTAAEAMACGAAVVVTDCGGPAEFAEHGRTALVVQPRDQSALREAIALLAEDATLRSRLARAGAAHAATMGWPPRADALEQVLASIAQPSTSTASRPQVE